MRLDHRGTSPPQDLRSATSFKTWGGGGVSNNLTPGKPSQSLRRSLVCQRVTPAKFPNSQEPHIPSAALEGISLSFCTSSDNKVGADNHGV